MKVQREMKRIHTDISVQLSIPPVSPWAGEENPDWELKWVHTTNKQFLGKQTLVAECTEEKTTLNVQTVITIQQWEIKVYIYLYIYYYIFCSSPSLLGFSAAQVRIGLLQFSRAELFCSLSLSLSLKAPIFLILKNHLLSLSCLS